LAPEYAKAAKRLKAQDPPIRIAKVDATVSTDAASKYGVQGYPTLKWFSKGIPKDYEGPREADGIVSWINKRLGPAVQVLDTLSALNDFIAKNEVAVVMYAQKDSEEANVFEGVAKESDDVFFVLSTSTEALKEHRVTEPTLIVYKKFDDLKVQFTGSLKAKRMAEFIKNNKLPWTMPFNDKAIDYIFKQQNPVVFIFRKDSDDAVNAAMKEAAAASKDIIRFCYADLNQESNKRLGDYLGVVAADQPAVMIAHPNAEGVDKYKFTEGSISSETLQAFAVKFRSKQLEPFYKSQEIPEEPYDEGVRIIVAKNFESVVMDSTKDVMLEFYAPWCGHCKQLAPEYVEVAEHFKSNPNIIIAKIDATANEIKGHSIRGFPTLKFFSSKNKEGVVFEGDRKKEAIISYIEKEATSEKPARTDL
jgi:protein disulfide-isomerase A1